METITLDLSVLGELTDEILYQLSHSNPAMQFERKASGELLIMPLLAVILGIEISKLEPIYLTGMSKLNSVLVLILQPDLNYLMVPFFQRMQLGFLTNVGRL